MIKNRFWNLKSIKSIRILHAFSEYSILVEILIEIENAWIINEHDMENMIKSINGANGWE